MEPTMIGMPRSRIEAELTAPERANLTLYKWGYNLELDGFGKAEARRLAFLRLLVKDGRLR